MAKLCLTVGVRSGEFDSRNEKSDYLTVGSFRISIKWVWFYLILFQMEIVASDNRKDLLPKLIWSHS